MLWKCQNLIFLICRWCTSGWLGQGMDLTEVRFPLCPHAASILELCSKLPRRLWPQAQGCLSTLWPASDTRSITYTALLRKDSRTTWRHKWNKQLRALSIRNWSVYAMTIGITIPTRRSPSSALVATRTAGTTTSCRLHLLANRAVIWQVISGSLHKTTCCMPCSPNQTPPRERSRSSPTKIAHFASIRSRKYVGSSCKTSKDALQVCIECIWYMYWFARLNVTFCEKGTKITSKTHSYVSENLKSFIS